MYYIQRSKQLLLCIFNVPYLLNIPFFILKPVAYVDWNDDYAPDGWDYGTLGRPRVLAMAVTDDPPAEPAEHVGYDEAVAMARDVARRS